MATIIDALLITLGYDTKDLKRGGKEARDDLERTRRDAKRGADDIADSGKRAAEFFTRIRNEALTMLAVFTAGVGLKDFISQTITSNASLQRLSSNLGMTTKDVAEWQLANQRAGGTIQGMTAQLQQAQQSVANFKAGISDEKINAFFRFGGHVEDLKNTQSYLKAMSDIVAKLYRTDPGKADLVARQLGISDDTFNLLKQGSAAVEQQRQAQARLAQAQADAAPKAEALRQKFNDLKTSLESTGVTIVTSLMPLINQLLASLQKLADWVSAHQSDIKAWADQAVVAIGEFVRMADKAADAVGGWQTVLLALVGLKVASAVTPLLSLAGALLKVGGALGGISGAGGALGVLGKLGVAGVAANVGLQVAKAVGLPDVDQKRGEEMFRNGDLLGASTHMSAGSFLKALAAVTFGNQPEFDSGVPGGPASARGTSVVNQLMKLGWTREQAAGIAGNFQRESQFDPSAVGDNGQAYGIGQWHPDRQAEFKRLFGKDIRGSSLEEQVQFANWELTQGKERGAGDRIRATTSAEDAARAARKYYERPDPTKAVQEDAARSAYASQIYAATGQANALAAAQQPGPAQLASSTTQTTSTSTSSSEVHIGAVTVQTQATDARGIARDIGPALQDVVGQANSGLS